VIRNGDNQDHARSKSEILVERAGDFARQLEASQLRTRLFKIA
jgi:hypothetical protein